MIREVNKIDKYHDPVEFDTYDKLHAVYHKCVTVVFRWFHGNSIDTLMELSVVPYPLLYHLGDIGYK